MKQLATLIILTISTFSFAQNFNLIREGHIHYFKNSNGDVRAISLDSIIEKGDTTFYHNFNESNIIDIQRFIQGQKVYSYEIEDSLLIQNDASRCLFQKYSWLGKKISSSKGKTIITNIGQDSIILYLNAPLDSSWHFAQNTNGNNIIAEVIQIEDSNNTFGTIKTIQLHEYDSNNSLIDSKISNTTLSFSNTMGIVKGISFLQFPDSLQPYTLFAWDDAIDIKNQILTKKRLFDYSVGDEFHISRFFHDPYSEYTRIKILEHTQYSDSIVYSYNKKTISITYDMNTSPTDSYTSVTQNNTTNVVIKDINNPALNLLPHQSLRNTPIADYQPNSFVNSLHYLVSHNEEKKYTLEFKYNDFHLLTGLYYIPNLNETCELDVIGLGTPTDYKSEYKESLWPIDILRHWDIINYSEQIIYTNKNGIETGSPYDFITSVPEKRKERLNIYPTIASDWITIPKAEYSTIHIYDMLGIEIYNWSVSGNQVEINQLKEGKYILQIESENNILIGDFIKQ